MDLRRLAGSVKASWFDPTDGTFKPVVGPPFANNSIREFTPPEKNAAGETDWALVLESTAAKP